MTDPTTPQASTDVEQAKPKMSLPQRMALAAMAKAYAEQVAADVKRMQDELLPDLKDAAAGTGAKSFRATHDELGHLATFTLKESHDRVVVVDEAAFVAWVESFAPEEIDYTPRIRSSYRTVLLKALTIDGDQVINTLTGEPAQGCVVQKGAGINSYEVRFETGSRDRIAEAMTGRGVDALMATEGGQ